MESNQRLNTAVELIELINKGYAHMSFKESVTDLPAELRNRIPAHLPYSIWQLVEHIRITQWDIVEFCLSAKQQSLKWPEEYWTENPDSVSDELWEHSLQQINDDRERFYNHLKDEKNELITPFTHGTGQNLLREALLIADHTSYHTGQIIIIRRLFDNWE